MTFLVYLTTGCSTSTKITSSWAEPNLNSPMVKGKIAVIAKIDDHALRRSFEDKITTTLNKKGLTAISAYNNFSEDDLIDDSSLLNRTDQLNVGAVLAIYPLSEKVKYTRAPTVSTTVGVPVDFGFGPVF